MKKPELQRNPARHAIAHLTRRDFLSRARWTPAFFFPASFRADDSYSLAGFQSGFQGSLARCHVDPRYRTPDPMGETLKHVKPGGDGFVTEGHAAEMEAEFERWSVALVGPSRGMGVIEESLGEGAEVFSASHPHEEPVRGDPDLRIVRRRFGEARATAPKSFVGAWAEDLGSLGT
ncbi:MAG: hypothetical protein DMG22_14800, partial [Acidobacteria bacterium]